jgi:hypothetical protein
VSSEAAIPPQSAPISVKNLLPIPVWITAVLLIVIGLGIVSTRKSRLESSTYEAISSCEATTKYQGHGGLDGLSEEFGLITFKRTVSEVTQYFSLCDTDPALALSIFRRALTNGNNSAKVMALYSSTFLAPHFEASDFQLMIACLGDKSPDVARVAQRAISDLTILKRVDNVGAYESLPAGLPPVTDKDAPSHKIETRKETVDGQTYLDIRWTDPDLTQAWWKANASNGVWDAKLHRFVVP